MRAWHLLVHGTRFGTRADALCYVPLSLSFGARLNLALQPPQHAAAAAHLEDEAHHVRSQRPVQPLHVVYVASSQFCLRSVLVLKKLGDELLPQFMFALRSLRDDFGLRCVVERDVYDRLSVFDGFGFVSTFFVTDAANGELAATTDFVVCLGGDGVILHASSLFSGPAPPIISFHLGSLGFLTTHRFEDFKEEISALIHGDGLLGGAYITLRMRLRCELLRRGVHEGTYEVLNEMVVNRGNNPYLSKIECYERDRLITKVQADGVIVATPTGSTAYSVSAGGSMVHPCVPAMLFTPVCPHSLSFRPVILPDSAELELRIPKDARDTAWVSFDGKSRHELRRGDAVRVRMSPNPLPTINKELQTNDWFGSLGRCLNWNERVEQGGLTSLGNTPHMPHP